MQTVGERIKWLREGRGLTQRELAIRTGLQRGNISHYERNKVKPSAEAIVQLATFFAISSDWLLTGKEMVKPVAGDRFFAERLKRLRMDRGLSPEALAEQTGVAVETVVGWENGFTLPEITAMAQLSKVFDVSLERLIVGEDRIFVPYLTDDERLEQRLITEFLAYRRREAATEPRPTPTTERVATGVHGMVREESPSYLPLLGPAGLARPVLPDVVLAGFVAVDGACVSGRAFALRVTDAMGKGSKIREGDLAIISYLEQPGPGELALVLVGDGLMIGRVSADGSQTLLPTDCVVGQEESVPLPSEATTIGRIVQVLPRGKNGAEAGVGPCRPLFFGS